MKYDNYHIFRYTYEKLTGVNLALLFANYFIDMTKRVGSLGMFDISKFEIGEDKEWKQNGKVYKEQLKKSLLGLLSEIMILPTVFGRIIWADIILQSLYAEEKKYIYEYNISGVYDLQTVMRFGYSSNAAVVVDILNNMEGIRREIKIERERFNTSEEYYTCFTVSVQYYEAYREVILERIKNIHQNEKDIVIYNQCSEVYNQIRQIISEADKDSLIGWEDIGKYIRKDVKDNPKKQMPVIFIRADIMDNPKYEEIVNEFLTYALVKSNKRE